MRAQIQRLALFTVLSLVSYNVFAACEDEVQFSLAGRHVAVEKPDDVEDKDRVRIMPVGQSTGGYDVKHRPEDGTIEVRRRKTGEDTEGLEPALIERWGARPGNQAFVFESKNQTFLIWVSTQNNAPRLAISKAETPLEPVFKMVLNPGDALVGAELSVNAGNKDSLSLRTEQTVYVLTID